jgi:putative endonuclease
MLRCKDNSIYTGITTDIERRMEEHFSKGEKCAKYTLTHSAIKLESVWQSNSRVLASKLEYYIKKLPKKQKEELIIKNNLEDLLGIKINCKEYKKCNCEKIDIKR